MSAGNQFVGSYRLTPEDWLHVRQLASSEGVGPATFVRRLVEEKIRESTATAKSAN